MQNLKNLFMDNRIREYCEHICKTQIEVLRIDQRTKVKFWDLPAMAVICHNAQHTKFAKGYSHKPQGTKWHSILKRELEKLEKLGEIGQKSDIGKKYIIGNCAEQHAGNNFMNRMHVNKLGDLYFTEAVRPRTMEIFPYCENCKRVFPNL